MGVGLKKPSKTVEALVKKAIKKKRALYCSVKRCCRLRGFSPHNHCPYDKHNIYCTENKEEK